MKIMIVEDSDAKRAEFINYAGSLGVEADRIIVASNMAEFMEKFHVSVGLCIIDLRIPAYDGGAADTNGLGVLQTIDRVGGGRVKLLAVSSYPEEFEALRGQFESRGCMLVAFDQPEVWKSAIRRIVLQVEDADALDFLIFCALRSERSPYTAMSSLEGRPVYKQNLSRLDIIVAGKRGSVIELPRMGLVDAAVLAATCIERFRPEVVAMSGVCAGFPGRAEMGQLLVSEMAYEYQSGKWTTDGFSQEPYQVPVSENVRNVVNELVDEESLLVGLEVGWRGDRPSQMSAPKLASFTSGSAVIANEALMEQVAKLHRRVAGLDMEIYAVHRAAHVASCTPDVVCAKVVVDLAGSGKDDKLQPYGASISAQFVVRALENYFSRKPK